MRPQSVQPAGLPRAMLLAAGIGEDLSMALSGHGFAVSYFSPSQQPTVEHLGLAALELRKAHPELPLFTLGPNGLVTRFERLFPPLTDGASSDRDLAHILSWIDRQLSGGWR